MPRKITFIDLFAGCGGLSEGFVQAGFSPLVHIEMDKAACYSLKTRMAFHYLSQTGKTKIYSDYLLGKIDRDALYKSVPKRIIDSVVNSEIGSETLKDIFVKIDHVINKNKLDLIVGGPPCQAYSLVGRARDAGKMRDDKRNWLFKFYIEFLKKYKPRHFVFENVMGLLSAKDKNGTRYFDLMMKGFKDAGYVVPEPQIISADKYGVPQNRRRIIIVGTREGFKPIKLNLLKQVLKATISQIFGDLPPLTAGDKFNKVAKTKKSCAVLFDLGIKSNFPVTLHKTRPHNKRDLDIYKLVVEKWNNGDKKDRRLNYNDIPSRLQTHKNKTAFTDRFKVVGGDLKSAHTVVAHISKDGHYYIHPDINQNRSISPREAARLQTFPDDYYFESTDGKESLTSAFKQIGNAVPVYLAKQIAENIKRDMKNE
ncbi:MAG: DNA cytosine methyltransferase [Rickettsiales bacterium]|jgi:DNA (cytosine-5)-methyltransferase 1|nr:DNA cytosine methyltransferase [Rickettsiales bacterium]